MPFTDVGPFFIGGEHPQPDNTPLRIARFANLIGLIESAFEFRKVFFAPLCWETKRP